MIWNKVIKLLGNPKLILVAMLGGAFTGIYLKDWVEYIAPVGKLYMSLLTMVITPLLVVSISSSIASLLKNKSLNGSIKKIVTLFPLIMLTAAGIGFLLGVIGQAGSNLSVEAQDSLGKLIASAPSVVSDVSQDTGLWSLLELMVPGNIFSALTRGNNLAVLFFSILLGVGLGFVESKESKHTVELFNVLYQAMAKVIQGIMYGLPIGLFCLFAEHISHVGPGIIFALGKFVGLLSFGCLLIVLISWFVTKKKLNLSWKELYSFLKDPSIVSFSTSSSLASIPAMLKSFEEKTKLSKDGVHLFVPLSICLNAVGSSFIVSLTAIFMMEIYGIGLSLSSAVVVLVGSILTSIAMSGAPGIGALAMLGIVMKPLGIPLEPTIVLMLAVMPIVEGLITLSNVTANVASITYLAQEEDLEASNFVEMEIVVADSVQSVVYTG